MDRTEATIAPAGGGDRTPRTRVWHPRPWRLRRAGAILLSATAAAFFGATNLSSVAPGAAAAAAPADHLTLVRQSPWVGPAAPNQNLTMGLRIRSGTRRGALRLSITVYQHLTSRSAFVETLNGRGLGTVVAQSPALPVSALTTDAQGVTHLTIPVVGDTTPTATGDWTADLGCHQGGCADVYPVKVALTDSSARGSGPSSGTSGPQFITYLIYDDPSPTSQPLRFSLVAPLGLAPPTADGAGRLPTPSTTAVAGLDGLVSALAGTEAVPVTLEPDPATLEHLAASGRSHPVSAVAALSTSPARQTLSESFVPVDASALVDAGLSGELATQRRRATEVLASPGAAVHASKGTWVARAPLDQAALDQLAPDTNRVVVPPAAVSGPTGPLTPTQPFTLTSGHGATPTAVISDAGLRAHLVAGKGADASLAAIQLLADLSFIYYEAPNLRGPTNAPAPRGVVAVAPTAWATDTTFVSTLLAGLEGNPVIRPVTLDQLFDQVPVGADRQATTRHPVTTGAPTVPAGALRSARTREAAFRSAVAASPAGIGTAQALGDRLLAAESSSLTPRQQQAAVGGFEAALDQQLHGLSVRSDTIRLTAGTASVPLTVLRNTPYPVTVVVRLTSDKLRFPGAGSQVPGALCKAPRIESSAGRSSFSALCVLSHATNAVYVNMQARASGDFRVDVTLTSPRNGLVLAGGQLTVRSMSTSAVAIALSAGAAAVLLVWWGRTLWRGKARRGAHIQSKAGGPAS